MKSEKDYLMKIRYLYMLKHGKVNLSLVNGDVDFKNNYYKDREEWRKKFVGIK